MPIREIWQPHNRIGATLYVSVGGVPRTGLAATTHLLLERRLDGLFWDVAANNWLPGPPPAIGVPTQTLLESDPANFPGNYTRVLSGPDLDYDLGIRGYRFVVTETTSGVREGGIIFPDAAIGGIWKEDLGDILNPGDNDPINAIFRMLSLRQEHMRFVPSAWDATTRQPTAGLVLLYTNKTDATNDVAPWPLATHQYTITAGFDGSGQLTGYLSVRDS